MAKRRQQPNNLDPAGSRVRPGMRRSLMWLVRTGKVPALLIACLCGWGLYDALTSARYKVQIVDAVGIQALTADDVRTFAAVDTQSIWYVDTDEVSDRVRQSPYVQEVRTRLILPNKVEVAVAERKPEVRWMHNGEVFAVTWDGIVVDRERDVPAAPPSEAAPPADNALPLEGAPPADAPAEEAPPAEVPMEEAAPVEGAPVDAPPAEAAVEVAPPPEALDAPAANTPFESVVTIVDTTPDRPLTIGDHVDPDALELARRISLRAPTELPVPISRIEWDAGLGVSLILDENRQAVIGRSDNLDQKLATLRYLLHDATPFTFIDLRPSTPYYR